MAEARLHRSSSVTSEARSYKKRTRSVVEAQKTQVLANAGASVAISIFFKSAMIAMRVVEAPSGGVGV